MATRAAADLDLTMLPIEDPAFAADPNPALAQARAQHPWLARFSHGYVIHSYQAIRDLLPRDDDLQIAIEAVVDIMGARGTPWGGFMSDMMIGMRGADHQRLRGAIEPYFKPRSVVTQLDRIREVVVGLLDEWAPRGTFDFVEFSAQFPVTIMFSLIGGDPADLPRIQHALETQGLSFSMDPSLLPELEAGYDVMMAFTDELIAKRRAGEPRNDLLQALIGAEDSGELSPKEVRELLFFLFGAGYDTSKNQLTLTVWMLLDRPDLWERCAKDREFCNLAVEEAFRLASPSNVPRVVLRDIEYEGVHFPAGTHLVFLNNLATRDPTVMENPLRFDPERDHPVRHIAFGRGAHRCLGMHLARLQIEEGLHLITQAIKAPRLAGEVTWRRFPGVWGIEALPLSFTPAKTGAETASA